VRFTEIHVRLTIVRLSFAMDWFGFGAKKPEEKPVSIKQSGSQSEKRYLRIS
jgi:hypothetical protein